MRDAGKRKLSENSCEIGATHKEQPTWIDLEGMKNWIFYLSVWIPWPLTRVKMRRQPSTHSGLQRADPPRFETLDFVFKVQHFGFCLG